MATGSSFAAAASSSTKLSTAKQLPGLPGDRIGAGRSGVSLSQCAITLTALGGVGRIAVLHDLPGADAARLVDAGGARADQRRIGEAARRLRNEQVGAPVEDAAVGIDGGVEIEHLRRTLGIPAVLVLAHPLHAHRPADRARHERGVGGGVLVAVHAVAARAFEIDHADLVLGQVEEPGEEVWLPCVPCEAVQIVAPSGFTSATAQDGPIEPCVWIGQ